MTATFGVTLPEARSRRLCRFQSSDETEGRSDCMEREENKSSRLKTRMHSLADVRVLVLIFECVFGLRLKAVLMEELKVSGKSSC